MGLIENLTNNFHSLGKGICSEKYPTKCNKMEGENNTYHFSPSGFRSSLSIAPSKFVQGQCNAVQASPSHEFPTSSMPKPSQQHGHHQVHIRSEFPFPISSKCDVQIISKPAAQTHVPSAPKLGNAGTLVRHIEIGHKPIAHQPS